jgi:2-polyprenyl-3-methyl-5-hydroxy-6-metoxy-1,4-benzoquinol methylase
MQEIDGIEAYGRIAALGVNPTVQAGRYPFQAGAERNILADVVPKLKLESHHRVLDIGCGAGLLTIPLSWMVREVVALDHPETVAALARRYSCDRVRYVGGRFPDDAPEGPFDRVVAYSVILALRTYDMIKPFALAAARLIGPGGLLMLGDIPNLDRQARFRASDAGKEFEAEWARLRASETDGSDDYGRAAGEFAHARQVGGLTDAQMFDLLLTLRAEGCEAYLAAQSPDLPFGRTREDIIVTRF